MFWCHCGVFLVPPIKPPNANGMGGGSTKVIHWVSISFYVFILYSMFLLLYVFLNLLSNKSK